MATKDPRIDKLGVQGYNKPKKDAEASNQVSRRIGEGRRRSKDYSFRSARC
jgi:hypothetical protein